MTRPRQALPLGTVLIVGIAFVFFATNAHGPVQRDGSHFVFMAVNMAAGQPPYWASFETKNPFVEYLWAASYAMFSGTRPVLLSRLVEHTYLATTAFAVLVFAVHSSRRLWAGNLAAVALASLYLCAALDWRVTDDGLNIALYQSLPELAAVCVALRIVREPTAVNGAILGFCCFVAWFTKQTSLVALALPAGLAVVSAMRRREFLRCAACLVMGAVLPAAAWFGYLWTSGTLDNYALGTMTYRMGISSGLWLEFGGNFLALFRISGLDAGSLAWQYHKVLAWLLLLALPLAAGGALLHWRRGEREQATNLVLVVLWWLGVFIQAVAGLTFFRHYFLACLAPAALTIALLLGVAHRPLASASFAVIVGTAAIGWTGWYATQKESNAARGRDAPMTHTVAALSPLLPVGATVFNWNGLPHFHAYTARSSDYPLNMWWPWILGGLDERTRDDRLHVVFRNAPPDRFLEILETYPPNQGLRGVPLTPELLRRWTGRQYELMATISPPAGRYGVPARVFWRLD